MFRSFLLLIILSIIVGIWLPGAEKILLLVKGTYSYVSALLSVNIGGYEVGETVKVIVTLVILPLLAAMVLRFGYWLTKRPPSAAIPGVSWGIWLIMVTLLATKAV